MKVLTGNYSSSLIYFSGLMVIAFIISILMRMEMNKLRKGISPKEENIQNLVL